jgi:archaellum component FlaC
LRQSIEELEQQLRDSKAQERAQHEDLEHLDEYINAVDTKFSSLKLFWQTLKQEWRSQ